MTITTTPTAGAEFQYSRSTLPTRDAASLLERYYGMIVDGAGQFEPQPIAGEFEPSMRLPKLDAGMSQFLSPATAGIVELGRYKGLPLRLLDLRQNPNTQTTKTFASLLIVARAVRHIQDTGNPVLLFSPSSGNKAIALRDAVARALTSGLVRPDQLRIATLTPEQTVGKLRKSILSEDPELRRLNPAFVLHGPEPEAVKAVGQKFKQLFNAAGDTGMRLWHSLRIENYRFADQVRAFYDYEFGTAAHHDQRTVHVHAVSSAYGLLGYASGIEVLKAHGCWLAKPQFLLVQHMATCDMVVHLLSGGFAQQGVVPAYARQDDGVLTQQASPHFPQRTWAAAESLEHTFYTHKPATATEMSALIGQNGGSGIVVSLLECFERYAECRQLLEKSDIKLPADPRKLTEWSLVMALTGVLNAIDRGLLPDASGFTVHASGVYGVDDYERVADRHLSYVDSADDMLKAVLDSAA